MSYCVTINPRKCVCVCLLIFFIFHFIHSQFLLKLKAIIKYCIPNIYLTIYDIIYFGWPLDVCKFRSFATKDVDFILSFDPISFNKKAYFFSFTGKFFQYYSHFGLEYFGSIFFMSLSKFYHTINLLSVPYKLLL